MTQYETLSDDFYINLNLNTEMELKSTRETVLHYFEQVQKKYPSMRNFYSRDRGEYVLEEDKVGGMYRWATVESRRICSGYVNPNSVEDVMQQHALVLDVAPYALSLSPLDCESLNLMYGFDYTYRGNHDELVADVIGIPASLEKLRDGDEGGVIAYEPSLQIAISDDCRLQCRVSVETRTSAYHVRTGEYPEEQLSVYLTLRRYGSLDAGESFSSVMETLAVHCERVLERYVVEHVLRPLQETIAIK